MTDFKMQINYINYVGCFNKFDCRVFTIKLVMKKGNGKIFFRGLLDNSLIKSIDNISSLITFNFLKEKLKNLDFYIFIKPYNFIKKNNSIDLSIFFGLLTLIYNMKVDNKVCFTGSIDKYGYILPVGNFKNKFISCANSGMRLLIFSRDNFIKKSIFWRYNLNCIRFCHINDLYNLIYKRLTQR